MALQEFQFSLGGVTFGRGTVYRISRITGMGLGPKRERVFENAGADGAKWGREYRNGPTITWEGEIRCDGDPAAAWTALVALRTAFSGATRTTPQSTESLGIRMPGQAEGTIAGRPDRFDPDLATLGIGRIPFSATFVAAGPLEY